MNAIYWRASNWGSLNPWHGPISVMNNYCLP